MEVAPDEHEPIIPLCDSLDLIRACRQLAIETDGTLKRMNTNSLWATLALTVAVLAVVVWSRGDAPSIGRGGVALTQIVAAKVPFASESPPGANLMLARFNAWLNRAERPASTAQQTSIPAPASVEPVERATTPFKTDSVGQIVTDEAARQEIERLVALASPDELQVELQEITQSLPSAAAHRLPELIESYNNYSTALRQINPPDQSASSEQEALAQLDELHALRAQYFGAEVAEGFFAQEEKAQRELIKLMRLETDQSLTMTEQSSSGARGRD